MTEINKSPDSSVECLGIKGIYIIILAIYIVIAFVSIFIMLYNDVPLWITLGILCPTTAFVIFYLIRLSSKGKNLLTKLRCKPLMNYFITHRTDDNKRYCNKYF